MSTSARYVLLFKNQPPRHDTQFLRVVQEIKYHLCAWSSRKAAHSSLFNTNAIKKLLLLLGTHHTFLREEWSILYMYYRCAQAGFMSPNYRNISNTSIKGWWKSDFRYGQKLFFTIVDPGPLPSLSMVIGRRGRRRKHGHVPSTSKVVT